MLVPVDEDAKAAEDRLIQYGLSTSQIAVERKYHWKSVFLRFARRSAGTCRKDQLRRFDACIEEFSKHKDIVKNGEPLIRDNTVQKI